MEVTLKRRIASRGWHVYGKTVWQEPKRGESVFAEKETSEEALLADKFSVAWKRKLKTKLTADIFSNSGARAKRNFASYMSFYNPRRGDKRKSTVEWDEFERRGEFEQFSFFLLGSA